MDGVPAFAQRCTLLSPSALVATTALELVGPWPVLFARRSVPLHDPTGPIGCARWFLVWLHLGDYCCVAQVGCKSDLTYAGAVDS